MGRATEDNAVTVEGPKNPSVECFGTLLLALNWGVFVYAVFAGRATDASLGYFMLPLLTVLVGKLAFDEVLGTAQRIAICLAISAIVIRVIAHGSLPWISLVVSTSFALYGAIRKKIEADTLQGLFIEIPAWRLLRWSGCG